MSEVRDNYLRAVYKLSKKGGPEWFEFVEAFKVLIAYELERGTSIPTMEAQVGLGMNRRMVELKNDFTDIEQYAAKLRVR